MGRFNLNDYTEVKDRIPLFYAAHPDGRIVTHLTELDFNADPAVCVVKALLYRDHTTEHALATGHAYERETGNVNKTSFIENCETSAIGRALANAGFAGNGPRPSREEMAKVQASEELVAEVQELWIKAASLGLDETHAEGMARCEVAIRERGSAHLDASKKWLTKIIKEAEAA